MEQGAIAAALRQLFELWRQEWRVEWQQLLQP
jgi:hypothetical protein